MSCNTFSWMYLHESWKNTYIARLSLDTSVSINRPWNAADDFQGYKQIESKEEEKKKNTKPRGQYKIDHMEFEEGIALEPVSPIAQYCNSSAFQLSIIGVWEFAVPIDDKQIKLFVRDAFLQINPRFSSIMVFSNFVLVSFLLFWRMDAFFHISVKALLLTYYKSLFHFMWPLLKFCD